jgi:hypothetical protein
MRFKGSSASFTLFVVLERENPTPTLCRIRLANLWESSANRIANRPIGVFWFTFVVQKNKSRLKRVVYAALHLFESLFADRTGLEPATSAVTGRHSNQLNYRSNGLFFRMAKIAL